MAIDASSVGLLNDVSTNTSLKLAVDFWRPGAAGVPTRFLIYAFTNAVFTSYLLQDGPTGESVQVVFTFQKIQASILGANGPASATDTWSVTTNKAG
jgi:type VI protein secretion system component Hcp